MRLLANPLFIRSAVVMLTAVAAFMGAVVLMRILRSRILADDVLSEGLGNEDTSYAYSAVIQQLKQQKFALQHEQKEQQRRAKTSEQVAAAVITHLPCGVLLIAPTGLIKQANPAARQILGFASPLGMTINEIFKNSGAISESGESLQIADLLHNALRGTDLTPGMEIGYQTPSGDARCLKLSLVALRGPDRGSMGIACIITNDSTIAKQRRAELLRSEISAEMALELHTSLATIRECASRLALADDRAIANSLASDIAIETERLGKAVGGFLAAGQKSKVMAAGA